MDDQEKSAFDPSNSTIHGRDGGYDDGYESCDCFWGTEPGSLVGVLATRFMTDTDQVIIDAGCGEGKNSAALSPFAREIHAFDVSRLAIGNARKHFGGLTNIHWTVSEISSFQYPEECADVVVAYGLLHCLATEAEVTEAVDSIQTWTKPSGWNVICTFNDRAQDLERAHPGFHPILLSHSFYLSLYEGWTIEIATDTDLHERHPNNSIPHVHAMTRLLARKP